MLHFLILLNVPHAFVVLDAFTDINRMNVLSNSLERGIKLSG